MTKVKFCGITNLADAEAAVSLGADMLGLNFYEKSPRYISADTAREIVAAIPAEVWKVGVFVNMESYRVAEFVDLVGLDTVQIHGDEDSDYIAELRTETSAKIINVVRIGSSESRGLIDENSADYLLVDAHAADGVYGGSGQTFDWNLVKKIDRLFLAGGLTAENVADAVRIVRPFAVDAASGVESSPGKKDVDKMRRFINAVRSAV